MEDDPVIVSITLVEINCGCCGGTYAINKRYKEKCAEDGSSWTCPYCKVGWGYSGKGRAQQLEKQLEAERKARQEAESRAAVERSQRQAAETNAKRAQTRLKNVKHRVAAGTCPCCNRTFKQLAAHMANKHPEYTAEGAKA